MKFKNGSEMYKAIVDECIDLYSPSREYYLFVYNVSGSICEYYGIKNEDIDEWNRRDPEHEDPLSSYLTWNHSEIHDGKDAMDLCDDYCSIDDWVDIDDYGNKRR